MWKYILIIAFLLFAIREINLMNESLYIAPESHTIVAEDKTVIGKVVKVIKAKIHHPKAVTTQQAEENKTIPASKEISSSHTIAKQKPQPKTITPKSPSIPLPTHNNIEKTPQTAIAHKSTPSLAEVEKEANFSKTSPTRYQPQKSIPVTSTHPAHHTQPVISATPYSERYEEAQQRIREILETMHQGH